MIVWRILSFCFLAAALIVMVIDVASSLVGEGAFRLAALGEWWAWIHRDSLLLLQPAIERHLSPALWDPGIQTLLEWPAALEFAVLGLAFWLIARWRLRRRQSANARP